VNPNHDARGKFASDAEAAARMAQQRARDRIHSSILGAVSASDARGVDQPTSHPAPIAFTSSRPRSLEVLHEARAAQLEELRRKQDADVARFGKLVRPKRRGY